MYHPARLHVIETSLPGVLILEPRVFTDERGYFTETYNHARFLELGIALHFVQDNHSSSRDGVLRGLHFQEPRPQGKLVRCTAGSVFDVAADIRVGSPAFAQWTGVELSAENKRMLWIPPGFAHGFCTLGGPAELVYKCTEIYLPANDRGLAWNDPDIAIQWPIENPLVSQKDAALPRLKDAPLLPTYSNP